MNYDLDFLNKTTYITPYCQEEIYNIYGEVSHVRVTDDILKDKETSINKIMKRTLTNEVGKYYIIKESGQKVHLGKDLPGEYAYSKSNRALPSNKKNAKAQIINNIDELIVNASNRTYSRVSHLLKQKITI